MGAKPSVQIIESQNTKKGEVAKKNTSNRKTKWGILQKKTVQAKSHKEYTSKDLRLKVLGKKGGARWGMTAVSSENNPPWPNWGTRRKQEKEPGKTGPS